MREAINALLTLSLLALYFIDQEKGPLIRSLPHCQKYLMRF
ncbi:hypothetical protein [Candidatus Protochlamydia phocaeensis]|nr:hypothetical protein [Candidatus Protochlamydia phocaeensis]